MTKDNPSLKPLLAPLAALQRLLNRYEGKGIIIGGIAASLLGTPRLTADVDALVLLSIEELPELLDAARAEGLIERISDPQTFARQRRVVLLRHDESGIGIDISLGTLPFEQEMIARSIVVQLEGLKIRLPTPEDLIILKAVAHRPKDLLDIQGVIQSHPDLNRERIQDWVTQFAQLLEMPELWEDIAGWL
ncbi:MAG: nucleotidyltransferase [Anaerolineales bacterium]|nr:nucleotidyltransferase [Anaerolineales bacterium]